MKLFLAVLVAISILFVEVPVNANAPVASAASVGPSLGPTELQVLN
jgi:hypothetical protein